MSFDRDPDVGVVRKEDGAAQSLDHVQQPWPAPGTGLQPPSDPSSAAHQYLLAVAGDYHIPSGVLRDTPTAFTASTALSGPAAEPSFNLKALQTRDRFRSKAVIYQQTFHNLPVWDAKLSITVNDENRVINSSSSIHPEGVRVDKPKDDAQFIRNPVGKDDLRRLLALNAGADGVDIKEEQGEQQQLYVYRYQKDNRQEIADASVPTLILPPVPETMEDGHDYVVKEVLFSLEMSGHGNLNWISLIEVGDGTILYLRALTAGLHGWVFSRDPATKLAHSAPQTTGDISELNRLRERLFLPDIIASSPQALKGKYVEIKDIQSPASIPPTVFSDEFNDSVETDRFAATSAYRHIAKLFRLPIELGVPIRVLFENTNFPVPVDHRALNNAVNAQAPGNTTMNGSGGFLFGSSDPNSRIGIAADFRIAAHEFGHALLWDAIGSPNFGFAHSPGDSLAAIYCDPGSNATDRFDTFPWSVVRRRHDRKITDGWAWDGRVFRADRGRQYNCEQILSTTLFRLYCALGGDAIGDYDRQVWASRYTLYLILGGVASITTTLDMPHQYVSAMISADNGFVLGYPGGAARKVIRWSFEKQGLYNPLHRPEPVTTRGPPPAVDVYIDDGRDGEYDYIPDFGNALGVWNRHAPDGVPVNQLPNVGVVNYCYVAIKNRGTQDVDRARVRVDMATVPWATWPADFTNVGGVQTIPGPILANKGNTIITPQPFQWTPKLPASFDRYTLLASVSATGDLSNTDTTSGLACAVGPTDINQMVPFDNNLAVRHLWAPTL
ncbi:hypothetical protein BJX76DRAFT_281768 [Aspergillus varians]